MRVDPHCIVWAHVTARLWVKDCGTMRIGSPEVACRARWTPKGIVIDRHLSLPVWGSGYGGEVRFCLRGKFAFSFALSDGGLLEWSNGHLLVDRTERRTR
jgi:hypothetical protein